MSAWVCDECREEVSPMDTDEHAAQKTMETHLLTQHLAEGLQPDED